MKILPEQPTKENPYVDFFIPWKRTKNYTQRKYWIENCPRYGQRIVYQTLNPANGKWAEPVKGIYTRAIFLVSRSGNIGIYALAKKSTMAEYKEFFLNVQDHLSLFQKAQLAKHYDYLQKTMCGWPRQSSIKISKKISRQRYYKKGRPAADAPFYMLRKKHDTPHTGRPRRSEQAPYTSGIVVHLHDLLPTPLRRVKIHRNREKKNLALI